MFQLFVHLCTWVSAHVNYCRYTIYTQLINVCNSVSLDNGKSCSFNLSYVTSVYISVPTKVFLFCSQLLSQTPWRSHIVGVKITLRLIREMRSDIFRNIQEDKANDQTSRWSSDTNNPPQVWILLSKIWNYIFARKLYIFSHCPELQSSYCLWRLHLWCNSTYFAFLISAVWKTEFREELKLKNCFIIMTEPSVFEICKVIVRNKGREQHTGCVQSWTRGIWYQHAVPYI